MSNMVDVLQLLDAGNDPASDSLRRLLVGVVDQLFSLRPHDILIVRMTESGATTELQRSLFGDDYNTLAGSYVEHMTNGD